MSKILIVGANGMLGASLFRYFTCETEHEVLGALRSGGAASYYEQQGFENVCLGLNVEDLSSVERVVNEFMPDFVFSNDW